MSRVILLFPLLALGLLSQLTVPVVNGVQINRTSQRHTRRNNAENNYFKDQQRSPPSPSYRSLQPALSYRKGERPEEYITSYEADYGGVSSNFTSSAYDIDDNPPLYPNPETIGYRENSLNNRGVDSFKTEVVPDVELPDDSLADADLKDHNMIDSVTYLYGFSNNNAIRTEWILLVYVSRALACILVIGTAVWVLWSESAKDFRASSELYPVNVNLLCCLGVCNLIYMEAILGVSSGSRCEMVALLLHYAHLVCAVWFLALCWSVTDYCVRGTVPPLKYNYLFAYGVPAIMVLFNYALSMEQYETKHYCWMSLEKGMLFGFMLPGTILIVITTVLVLLGLKSINKKQSEILATKIQELIDHEIYMGNENDSNETLNREYSAGNSRKNTDSSDTFDREYGLGDDNYGNLGSPSEHCDNRIRSSNEITDDFIKFQSIRFGLMNMSIDNLSWKSASYSEICELKSYLNFCLVIQPFYAVTWVMGVVALENSTHWLTPAIFLVLCTCMYAYLAVQMCTTLPILRPAGEEPASCCEDVVSEPSLPRTRTTDSIPLLDASAAGSQQTVATAAPGDTISTISI